MGKIRFICDRTIEVLCLEEMFEKLQSGVLDDLRRAILRVLARANPSRLFSSNKENRYDSEYT
jgi:hypothetical protein